MKTIFVTILITISLNIFSQNVFTVTKTTDPDPFEHPYNFIDSLCDPEMYGTFQWAIRKANDAVGSSTIVFDIPGGGIQEIYLNYRLPQIQNKHNVTIDGSTQSGYQFKQPTIIIDGGDVIRSCFNVYRSDYITIKGLHIKNFYGRGILFTWIQNSTITENVINQIVNKENGGKIIIGRDVSGISLYGSTYNSITRNIIGTDVNNNLLGCDGYGILLNAYITKDMYLASNYNRIGENNVPIGSPEDYYSNVIANCGNAGILIAGRGFRNLITRNNIYENPIGISLIGGNIFKQPPVITQYDSITNTLTGTSQVNDIIEIFGSTGVENANQYLKTVSADGSGNWNAIIISNNYANCIGTATDGMNNTSGFSNSVFVEVIATKLIPDDCGATDVAFDQILSAENVGNNLQYEFYVFNGYLSYNESIIKDTNTFILNEFTGIKFNTSYDITVRTILGTDTSAWGDTCIVTTFKVPLTQLTDEFCNNNWIFLDQQIEADEISGATQYEFMVLNFNTGETETILSNDNFISLNDLSITVTYNTKYLVSVRPIIGGVLTNFGEECIIKTIPHEINTNKYVNGQLYVKIKETIEKDIRYNDNGVSGNSVNEIDTLITKYGIQKIEKLLRILDIPGLRKNYIVKFDSIALTDSIIYDFQNLYFIEYVEKAPIFNYSLTPNDQSFNNQWYLEKIMAEAAWGIQGDALNIVIAITDGDFNINHEDLTNIWLNMDEDDWIDNTDPATGNDIDEDGNTIFDDYKGADVGDWDNDVSDVNFIQFGHGTHVAGIAGATTNNFFGIASISGGAQLMLIKNSENSSGWTPASAVRSIEYAIAKDADIINMSWGTDLLTPGQITNLWNIIQDAANNYDIILVAAAGNGD